MICTCFSQDAVISRRMFGYKSQVPVAGGLCAPRAVLPYLVLLPSRAGMSCYGLTWSSQNAVISRRTLGNESQYPAGLRLRDLMFQPSRIATAA